MNPKRISISNYRSIKQIEFDIPEDGAMSTAFFLGINESGKSNILKAVALLSKPFMDAANYAEDCNKTAEEDKEGIEVRAALDISSKINWYLGEFVDKGMPEGLKAAIKVERIDKVVTIGPSSKESILEIWIKENAKEFSKWLIKEDDIKLTTELYAGKEIVTKENIGELVGEGWQILNKYKLESYMERRFHDFVNARFSQIIYWEPHDEYLIYEEIDLNQFKSDPKSCIPLRNIFRIAQIDDDDVKSRIELAASSAEKTAQLEEKLQRKITEHINKKWPEHKINFKIRISSMKCSVLIEEKDDSMPKYLMKQRSDGFKQFVSILLNLSAEAETEKLVDALILLDEPDVHLHPSGVKYLRDVLLSISKKNIVLCATHSIFMVDKKHIGRHFKVNKEESVSSLEKLSPDNPFRDDVVYEALGTSIYEIIEPNMLVFEGSTDKDAFDLFSKKFKKALGAGKYATMAATSADQVPKYTKFFNNKYVRGFIMLDSDAKGQAVKKQVLAEGGYTTKNTFEINDVLKTGKESTLEDLFPKEVLEEVIQQAFGITLSLDDSKPFMEQIKAHNSKSKGKLPEEKVKIELSKFISKDVSKLKKDDCMTKYKKCLEFCTELHGKVANYSL